MLVVRPLLHTDLEAMRLFTDREIGTGYYSLPELEKIFARSVKQSTMCSFVLEEPELRTIQGVRITYPPGQWDHGKGHGLCPQDWPHQLDVTAYFQSLFLAADIQGQGWGVRLSHESLKALRSVGARGVVCHSWKESPNDSSARYLRKLGFDLIAEHQEYWRDVSYRCTRCGEPPCVCTAQEMYLDLGRVL